MNYRELITEALIDPIRSVLIVDDQYPTWEGLLAGKGLPEDTDKIRQTIEAFRTHEPGKKPSLIVDIHDGAGIAAPDFADLAKHLHQSDLLVLDFQLEGDDEGGKKSVGIARELLRNDHFNLIIVHTAHKLETAFEEMVLGLLPNSTRVEAAFLKKAASEWEATVAVLEEKRDLEEYDIRAQLEGVLGPLQYLSCFKSQNSKTCSFREAAIGKGLFGPFKALMDEWEVDLRCRLFIAVHFLNDTCQQFFCFSDDSADHIVAWNDERITGRPFWIRTNRGFVAFAKKETTDLVPVLTDALENWQPTPIRLLSAKLRSQLDKQGVIAEDEVFKDQQVFRKFYSILVGQENSHKIKGALEAQLRRHTETLVDTTMGPVVEYGRKVVESDPKGAEKEFSYIDFFSTGDDAQPVSSDRYNSYMSTKPPSGWHMEPGHIFRLADDKGGAENYWVCLSPACDMVPGQRQIGLQWKDASIRPFLAVKLEQGSSGLTDDQINSNDYVFLEQPDGSIRILSLFIKSATRDAPDDEKAGEASQPPPAQNKQPHWRMFYACDGGEFDPQKLSDEGRRTANLQWLEASKGNLTTKSGEVTVSWQLRYEYALNLNQKLGSSLTRVGLEYST